jgi:hypothetical protein
MPSGARGRARRRYFLAGSPLNVLSTSGGASNCGAWQSVHA